jgi:hypothetical protein
MPATAQVSDQQDFVNGVDVTALGETLDAVA